MTVLNFYDRQHLTRMLLQEQRVNALFNQFVRAIAPEMRKWKDAGNRSSVWVRNSSVENAINKHLVDLKHTLESEIKNNQTIAWKSANLKNDKIVEGYIKGMALSSVVKEGMFSRNLDALSALQNRVDNGMNLSQRVWKITEQTKGNVELFLESGVATGRSAEAIGRDFRQLLENPDKRFRRVRDKNGKLVPSQPMKNYHPGQGVYRSARMNALRVSATETNMGYRLSDWERWQKLDFILGFEVHRSQNAHPCVICDALKGKYPKDFVFPGWHPFCICFATPITMEPDDFADYLLTDEIPESAYVRDIPDEAREWTEKYIGKSGNVPYYVKDNAAWFNNKSRFVKGIKNENNDIKKHILKREKTDAEKTEIQNKWNERKLYNSIKDTENEIRMNKDFETAVVFSRSGKVLINKRGEKYSVEFTHDEVEKIKDAIVTHNHPRGWSYPEKSLGRIGNSFSIEDINLAVKADAMEMRAVTPN